MMLKTVLLVLVAIAVAEAAYALGDTRGPQLIVEGANTGGNRFVGSGSHRSFGDGGNSFGNSGNRFGDGGSSFGDGGNRFVGGSGFGSNNRFDSGRQIVDRQIVTVTVRQTVDIITTELDFVYNTLPVIHTDFQVQTQTVATFEVVRTPGNDEVRITTREENRPTTIQVTDTKRDFRFQTNVQTDVYTITHTRQNVDFVTVTSTVQEVVTVTSRNVRTQFQTDYDVTTDMRYVTEYEYVRAGY